MTVPAPIPVGVNHVVDINDHTVGVGTVEAFTAGGTVTLSGSFTAGDEIELHPGARVHLLTDAGLNELADWVRDNDAAAQQAGEQVGYESGLDEGVKVGTKQGVALARTEIRQLLKDVLDA